MPWSRHARADAIGPGLHVHMPCSRHARADARSRPAHALLQALHDEVPRALGGGTDNVLYWENIEGGHGGAADNKQRAYMWALSYDFLWQSLALRPSWAPGTKAPPPKLPEEHA